MKDGRRKAKASACAISSSTLTISRRLNGDIHLEEEAADDAVQLMTVHAAKGLEFPNVFILHLTKRDFPSGPRPAKFEFPPELMKEEKPQGDFQIQEERRLFYVALTRARQHSRFRRSSTNARSRRSFSTIF